MILACLASLCPLSACQEPDKPEVVTSGPIDLIESLDVASVGPELVALDLGTPDSRRYLGHGWARNGQSPDRSFVWGLGESSMVRVHLSQPNNVALTLHARPFGGADLHDQTVTLIANQKEFATVPLDTGWSKSTVVAPSGAFRDGENNLELRYAWSAVPSELTDSDDQRALAVAFDRFIFDPDSTTPGLVDDRPRPVKLDLGAPGTRSHLVSGWGGREQGPQGASYCWATDRTASISIELGRPVTAALTIRARPFTAPDAPAQTVDVTVNDSPAGTWTLEEGWQEYTTELPASMLQNGTNTVAFSFSHATSPAEMGTGVDRRTLAAALDWLTVVPNDSPAVHSDGRLHLALGVRTAYPLTLPPSSTLDVGMPDQDSSLVVELKDMRSRRTQTWLVKESGQIQLSDADDAARVVQLALIARRGERAESLVLDRVTVDSTGAVAPRFTGLRPDSQATGDDPPASP
jgi:hypothetical protein